MRWRAFTSPNKFVKPVHAKAMPVLLLTDAEVETWLTAPTDEALKLQKPAPDDAIVVLPEEMKAFIEARMLDEGYASASEYLLALIREAQKRQARRELEAKLLDGLQGPAVEMTREDWDSIEQEAGLERRPADGHRSSTRSWTKRGSGRRASGRARSP